jgi:hypothetical protein
MARWLESRVLWGGLLILGGLVLLLENLGLFRFGGLFWALLLGLAGVFFLAFFISSRHSWWALIPGTTLLGVALIITLGELAPRLSGDVGGPIMLGSIALGFLLVYLAARENWWALIPGGVMLTLAFVSGLDQMSGWTDSGGIFFLGLGLTFALVAVAPNPQGPMRWAWIPAGILLLMGVLLMAAAGEMLAKIWPLFLIAGGAALLFRSMVLRR